MRLFKIRYVKKMRKLISFINFSYELLVSLDGESFRFFLNC